MYGNDNALLLCSESKNPFSISPRAAYRRPSYSVHDYSRDSVAFNAPAPHSQTVRDLAVLMYIFSLLLLLSCSIRRPGTASNVSEDGTFGRPTEPETAGSIIIIVIVVVTVIMRSFAYNIIRHCKDARAYIIHPDRRVRRPLTVRNDRITRSVRNG